MTYEPGARYQVGVSDEDCQGGRLKAQVRWSEGTIAAAHGLVEHICKLCALERQIKHAEERIAALPQMLEDYEALLKAVEYLK